MVDISVLYILKRSSLFSISYAFYWPFTTILLQQTALAAHLSVPRLQQNPQHYTPSLRQALQSNLSPSLPDIFRYIHLESVICAVHHVNLFQNDIHSINLMMLRQQRGNRQSHISSSSYSNRILLILNVLPLSIRQIQSIFYDRNYCKNII